MDKDENFTPETEQEEQNINNDMQDDAADLAKAASLTEYDESEEDEYIAEKYHEPDDAESEPLPDEDEEEQSQEVGTKRRPGLFRPILFVIIVCFCIIAAADIISQQNEIAQLEQETVMMNNKIEETKQLNDEYTALLEADEADFMERVAVEQLGYSYPNERRYYIVNKSAEK